MKAQAQTLAKTKGIQNGNCKSNAKAKSKSTNGKNCQSKCESIKTASETGF